MEQTLTTVSQRTEDDARRLFYHIQETMWTRAFCRNEWKRHRGLQQTHICLTTHYSSNCRSKPQTIRAHKNGYHLIMFLINATGEYNNLVNRRSGNYIYVYICSIM